MSIRLGVVMDPIAHITPRKDTSLALLLAAQRRGWELRYMEQPDLHLINGRAWARQRCLEVRDDNADWYRFGAEQTTPLSELDIILMRKDPPVDAAFTHATHILELAESEGVLVANKPASLRDVNEKLSISWFPDCCAPTVVDADAGRLKAFIAEQGKAVLKPLDGMGGKSIFVVTHGDPNTTVIIDTLTESGLRPIMAQQYLPAISDGDKRVLLINGEPVSHMLARVPLAGESRGNLAAGGRGVAAPIGDAERRICARVGPELRRRGLWLVGLDVIGDRLTEINVTSPTCVREIDAAFDTDIGGALLDALAAALPRHRSDAGADPNGARPSAH